jgi:integrase
MRKGELLALRKSDVDLPGGTIVVARSHAIETTKGGHADLLPIAEGLVPFLREALATSGSPSGPWLLPLPRRFHRPCLLLELGPLRLLPVCC